MTKEREALKLALEALEEAHYKHEHRQDTYKRGQAILTIEQALAQPKQHQSWCDSLNIMLMSMPPKPASCNCKQKDLEQPRQLAQEPVARIGMISEEHFTDVCRSAGGNSNTPLYTVPPKRKLIELTDKEIMEIDSTYYRPMGPLEFAKLLQIKLKEKNNA